MTIARYLIARVLVLLAIGTLPLLAADAPKEEKKTEDSKKEDSKPKEGEEKLSETIHSIRINGAEIKYTARAGTIVLRDAENKPTASIFYIAYLRNGVTNTDSRPLTFSFNGGPGSSSVWLHMGLLGPRRVVLEKDGMPLPPPYKTQDNEYSQLDETDLVFIDPVSTGYSRATKPGDAKNFHGVKEDVASVGEFIRMFVSRNKRWTSPKFIIGESYGTTRAAGLSGELSNRHRMNVNGIMLVSTVLNFQTIVFRDGNDLPFVLYLPSYTATAWYHKKLPADLQQMKLQDLLPMAEKFASGDYNRALLMGDALTKEERAATVKQIARFTGLSENFVELSDLRIPLARFNKELLAAEKTVIGRFDSRYKGHVRDRLADAMEYDPSGEAVFGAFTASFNDYVRRDLKFETDLSYEILTGAVQPWNWGQNNSYLNVAETLADSMTHNPFLKVYVAEGYYDMATPYFATRYTFNHLGVDADVLKNITIDSYTAGHMMYVNLPDLQKQKADISKFIRAASNTAR